MPLTEALGEEVAYQPHSYDDYRLLGFPGAISRRICASSAPRTADAHPSIWALIAGRAAPRSRSCCCTRTSQSVWTTVVEQLADTDRYEVFAPTMVGHNAGPAAGTLFLDTRTLADHVETQLDELGWGSAHIVGNSLGGWVAFELERRGRARTITDIAPAGRVDALLTGQVRGGAEVCARGTAVGGRLPARPAGC